ncbi:hydroxyisourate hydrolase [Mycobacterium sp. DL592]|uniref:hydroxyisourate hydrolase n=1 Tax=Mycobacterium sp. DL592 TaxID=2675524 RepID=UPI00141F475A|nr:hydroxyisourate hydrolase [Mycobacterium sp. DL592]
MAHLSTHVLDATTGRPAAGVTVTLTGGGSSMLTEVTDADGRISGLGGDVPAGAHRLHFDTGAYFTRQGMATFYPEVVISFEITDAAGKYHVPLLLSPYSYSTYRGS